MNSSKVYPRTGDVQTVEKAPTSEGCGSGLYCAYFFAMFSV